MLKLLRRKGIVKHMFKPFNISRHKYLTGEKIKQSVPLLGGWIAYEHTWDSLGIKFICVSIWVMSKS